MNQYVTGAVIKQLREERKMTQQELADIVHVSSKAVSKWETGVWSSVKFSDKIFESILPWLRSPLM